MKILRILPRSQATTDREHAHGNEVDEIGELHERLKELAHAKPQRCNENSQPLISLRLCGFA